MHKSKTQSKNPSFSSTVLDEIYNSIDAKNPKTQPFFVSDNMHQKQSTRTAPVLHRKFHRDPFFCSGSSSSDSNSSIFSSSDTEVVYGKKNSSRPLCFGPSRAKPRKTEDKALFTGTFRVSDEYNYISATETSGNPRIRLAKSSGNSKKVKTPVSPGGRIVNFLNSLFSNSRKTTAAKNNSRTSYNNYGFAGNPHDYSSACSSASSFSRSCVNKKISEKSSDALKRSVKFSPINFIFSENPSSRSLVGKSSFYVEEEDDRVRNRISTRLLSASLPDEWNIRRSQKKNIEDGGRRSVEEIAREFLKDYCKNQNKDTIKNSNDVLDDYEDEDEDDGSDSSSDLFELDLIGNHHNRYSDELPVYETTCAGLIL